MQNVRNITATPHHLNDLFKRDFPPSFTCIFYLFHIFLVLDEYASSHFSFHVAGAVLVLSMVLFFVLNMDAGVRFIFIHL